MNQIIIFLNPLQIIQNQGGQLSQHGCSCDAGGIDGLIDSNLLAFCWAAREMIGGGPSAHKSPCRDDCLKILDDGGNRNLFCCCIVNCWLFCGIANVDCFVVALLIAGCCCCLCCGINNCCWLFCGIANVDCCYVNVDI